MRLLAVLAGVLECVTTEFNQTVPGCKCRKVLCPTDTRSHTEQSTIASKGWPCRPLTKGLHSLRIFILVIIDVAMTFLENVGDLIRICWRGRPRGFFETCGKEMVCHAAPLSNRMSSKEWGTEKDWRIPSHSLTACYSKRARKRMKQRCCHQIQPRGLVNVPFGPPWNSNK